MATPETKMKQRVRKTLQDVFGEVMWGFAPSAGKFGKSGVPDLIYCIAGLFVGIEVKAGDKRQVTALQARQLQRITDAGGVAAVVRDEASLNAAVAHIWERLHATQGEEPDEPAES